jgi:hypothetical protein
MSDRLTVEEAKKLLSPGKGTARRGWFGSKGRNHVAFTIHSEEPKSSKRRGR